jgi:hypothetical protein
MRRLSFALILLLFTCVALPAAEPTITGYDEIVNDIIKSTQLDLSKIAIVNIPLVKRNSFYTVELDFLILGPNVKEVEEEAMVGCLVRNLIIFNPDTNINKYAFKVLATSRELGFDQQPGPKRLIANAPAEFIRRVIFESKK